MNINVNTPQKLCKFRRSGAENLVKNCGICSRKEAGEPVTPLLTEERSPEQEKCQMGDHPTDSSTQKGIPTEKRSMKEKF